MQSPEARQRADAFHRLHAGPQPLVLIHAWDAGSARLLERAGAPAIGISDSGVAWSLGYPRGTPVPLAELVAACARICGAVSVPVSVTIERGFGGSADELSTVVEALIGLGVAGVELGERIATVRALATQMGARLFINARIDSYAVPGNSRASRYDDTLQKAHDCISAGADGVFVPGLDLKDVVRFVRAVPVAVTVDVGDGWGPPVYGLAQAGVRRVCLGLRPLQGAFGLLRQVAREVLERGSYSALSATMPSVDEVDELVRAP